MAYDTAATASTLAQRDANANLKADAFIASATSQATAASVTTLTADSTQVQGFTGATTQTVKLPSTGITMGMPYAVPNQSTGVITVQSSGGNTITTVRPGFTGYFVAQKDTPTTAADWQPFVPSTSGSTTGTLVQRDSNAFVSTSGYLIANNNITTSGGTTTLSLSDGQNQILTGTQGHTVKLASSGVTVGWYCTIVNQSTAAITVQSSGANNIATVAPGTSATFTAQASTPTTAAGWQTTTNDIIAVYSGTQSLSSQPTPAGIKGVRVTGISPGGAGGSGRCGASSSARSGGGGGGSGALLPTTYIPAASLGTTWSLTIGAAPTGGASVSTAANGNAGGARADITFTSGSVSILIAGGSPGAGGTTTTASGGAGGWGTSVVGVQGGAGGTGAGGVGTGHYGGGAGAGGAGGGLTTGNAAANGGNGGEAAGSNIWGGSAGVVGGASPGQGSAALAGVLGDGAGGGAASVAGAAQAGATALGFGSGGGGGGASVTGQASGPGGNGGPGLFMLEWHYG